jgi:hypothetical protein
MLASMTTFEALPFGIERIGMWRDVICPLLLANLERYVSQEPNSELVIIAWNKATELLSDPLVQADPIAVNGCKDLEDMCRNLRVQR